VCVRVWGEGCACVCMRLWLCMCACVCVRLYACVRVSVCACVHVCASACLRVRVGRGRKETREREYTVCDVCVSAVGHLTRMNVSHNHTHEWISSQM